MDLCHAPAQRKSCLLSASHLICMTMGVRFPTNTISQQLHMETSEMCPKPVSSEQKESCDSGPGRWEVWPWGGWQAHPMWAAHADTQCDCVFPGWNASKELLRWLAVILRSNLNCAVMSCAWCKKKVKQGSPAAKAAGTFSWRNNCRVHSSSEKKNGNSGDERPRWPISSLIIWKAQQRHWSYQSSCLQSLPGGQMLPMKTYLAQFIKEVEHPGEGKLLPIK